VGAPLADGVEPEVLEAAIQRLIAVAGISRTRQGQLQYALETRIVIEQAKGVLAERHGISMDDAFDRLRRASRASRRRIHDVAREIVADASNRRT
jgi:AmiR/NasT family two-component response regulator